MMADPYDSGFASLPYWDGTAAAPDSPAIQSQNDGPWTTLPVSTEFMLDGTQTDSTYMDPGPAPLPVAAPEPSTLVLLGAGLLGLVVFKNKLRLTTDRLGSISRPS
jgi:hypothetical protein